jgi:hypothetical protein
MLIVRKKREHALLLYFLKSNKKKVAKLHVFRAPKNVHVADVVRLPFGYFFDSTRTNLIEWHKHHVDCAQEERTCFAFVFIEIEQKESGEIACFSGAQKRPCLWLCGAYTSPTGGPDGSLESP